MVGTWSRTSADVELFSCEASWSDSPSARPLSLTLPFLPGNEQHRGPNVGAWFENLLPDSSAIRTRMACRLGVSNNPRSLLADIGRDCVGAVQLLGSLGFDVATVKLATFREDDSTERALVVERFERRWRNDKQGLIRLPQEDMCQATGTAPNQKYESEGGPGINTSIFRCFFEVTATH